MQEEMEHQQQTSLDGFGDNTFVDSPQDPADSDFIISNKNINIIRTGFTKSSHLDINEANAPYTESNSLNMEQNVAVESNSSDHVNSYDKTKSSIGVNLRVTGQCCQGGRKYMEDFFSVAYQQTDNMRDLEYAFIGIYDGHGGSEAATFAKEHLMMEIINQKQFWSDSDQDVLRAIREGYIATHFAMWREQENWPKTTNGLLSTAGTTATIAFIRNEKIYIGHVGDSGVVLGYQNEGENFWRAKQLTTDHKPESPAERSRIMHAGGRVGVKSGVPRVVWTRPRNHGHRGPVRANTPVEEIPFLAVARSLGDLWSYNAESNEFVVSPDPDVQVIDINPNTFRCLIFGTDGLWNVVAAQEAVDTVFSREKMNESIAQNKQTNEGKNVPWINPSKGLVELALRTWSEKKMRADNTSVVTVILYPPANNVKSAESAQIVTKKTKRKGVNDADFATLLDDKTSFQEISEKYLRPERFRHINNHNYDNVYWNSSENELMRQNNWLWRCDNDTETEENEVHEEAVAVAAAATATAQSLQSFDELAKPRTAYTNATRIVDIENVEKINSVDHSDLYVNSFAETYNSLLDAQISRSSKEPPVTVSEQSATTSTPLSSSSGLHMQQILQEQQMYQEQCMSCEEGYKLTTLETRREQQRFGGMEAFKVFEADQSESSSSFNADNSIQLNLREDSISYIGNTAESCDNDKLPAVLEKEIKVEAEVVAEEATPVLLEEKEIKEEPLDEAEVPKEKPPFMVKPITDVFIKQEVFDEDLEKGEASRIYASNDTCELAAEKVEQEQERRRVQRQEERKQQKSSAKRFKSNCDETTPSLVEDEDGVLEGARSTSPLREQRFRRKCYVQITDVSYDEEAEKISTHAAYEERIDEIEILADKPELVIESGPTTSKPNTRSATGSAQNTKNDKQYFKEPPPFYKQQRQQPGLRSYNGWMPGKSARLPTEEQFSEFIRANMDYAAASAFSSFVDAMKRHFPGFNVDNTLFSKMFDPRFMRYHDFTINNKNAGNQPNRNNVGKGPMPTMSDFFGKGSMPTMSDLFGKGAMPNMSDLFSKGAMPNMSDLFGKGAMPSMFDLFGKGAMSKLFGKGTMPTAAGKSGSMPTNGKAKGQRTRPEGEGEMIVHYFLLKQKQFAAEERKSQSKDETTNKKKTDGSEDDTEDDDDEYNDADAADIEYYESILSTWMPLMDYFENPAFLKHVLKSKDFMNFFETVPDWFASPNMGSTTNGKDMEGKSKATTATTTASKATATTSKADAEKVERNETGSKGSSAKETNTVMTKKPATTTTASTLSSTPTLTSTSIKTSSANTKIAENKVSSAKKATTLTPTKTIVTKVKKAVLPIKTLTANTKPAESIDSTAKETNTVVAKKATIATPTKAGESKDNSAKETNTVVAKKGTTTATPTKTAEIKDNSAKETNTVVAKKGTTTTTPIKTLTANTKPAESKDNSAKETNIVVAKKATTPTTPTKTKCEKEVQIQKGQSIPAPKSCKMKKVVKPTTVSSEIRTRASKRPTTIESSANTKSAVGTTSSTTAAEAENIIGTLPAKRIKR